MKTHFRSILLLAATAGLAAAQTPSILGLNPLSIPTGSSFVLAVSGNNIQSGAIINWNSVSVSGTLQSVGQLAASIPASFTATPGTIAIQVVNPNGLRSNTLTFTVTGSALTISTAGLPGGTIGLAYTSTLAATGGVPPYTWSATTGLPSGLTLSSGGVLSGTPAAGGSYNVGVRVTDSQGAAAIKSLPLSVAGIGITPPVTLSGGTVSQFYSQTLSATGGRAPYTWATNASLPAGLSLNSGGVISGTPSLAGTFSFGIQVTDATGQSATQTFSLTINAAPLTNTTVTPLFDGIVGTLYSQTFSASGGLRPYQWSIISGSTGDLRLDPVSGALQGTPQTAGTLNFTIQVTDSAGARVSGSYTITIRPPSLTIVTGASLPAGAAGAPYSQQFSVVGGIPPYTWLLTSGSASGMDFDASRGVLSGTPDTPGTFTFTLQARDSAGVTTSRIFTIAISPATLTITTAIQLPDGTLGAPYSYQMNAAGGLPPYTWSATGLPAGLTIDGVSGIISGILNAADPPAFAVRVVDSARLSSTNQFRISAALPRVPTITLTGLPATIGPAQQVTLQISIDSAYPTAISGQATVSFSPEVGGSDGTIQFSTGGVTAPFTIPAGATTAGPIALQTGTVAGQLSVSLRLQAGGLDVTPSLAPALSARIDQAQPVIQTATFTRSGSGLNIQIAGYSTAREITQAIFTFSAVSGQSLQTSQITVPVDTIFGNWYKDAANTAYGSQFVYTQPFTIQGDAGAVIPQSVTLVNRKGTVTATLAQ